MKVEINQENAYSNSDLMISNSTNNIEGQKETFTNIRNLTDFNSNQNLNDIDDPLAQTANQDDYSYQSESNIAQKYSIQNMNEINSMLNTKTQTGENNSNLNFINQMNLYDNLNSNTNESLTNIDLSNFIIQNDTNINDMFYECNSLIKTLIIKKINN